MHEIDKMAHYSYMYISIALAPTINASTHYVDREDTSSRSHNGPICANLKAPYYLLHSTKLTLSLTPCLTPTVPCFLTIPIIDHIG
jgi:hypothetical protein